MNIALYMVCPDNLYNPMNLTSQKSVTSTENCLNYLVFSFVLSRYQVVHGLWREILIWGVEWRGGRGECRGCGRGKHRITGGHRALGLVILHEVVQVGLWDSKNVKNSLRSKFWNKYDSIFYMTFLPVGFPGYREVKMKVFEYEPSSMLCVWWAAPLFSWALALHNGALTFLSCFSYSCKLN